MANETSFADHARTTLADQLSLPLVPSKKPRRLLWVDGVNSAVMAHLMLMEDPDAQPVHCDLGESVDPDSHRFVNDLEQWYGKAITRIRSERYRTIDDVFETRRYLSGRKGAPCTGEMKFAPRMDFQLPSDIHFWGYAADKLDAKRFRQHGIRRPLVYDLGMPNGNCIGCVKSSSPSYWALIRKEFPEVFERRNEQCRRFGARLVILGQRKGENGKRQNIRGFLDEIPADQSTKIRAADFGGCGFHCNAEKAA